MKRISRIVFTGALAFFITLNLTAQGAVTGKSFDSTAVRQDFGEDDVSMLTLPNGFSIFVKEDYSQALVHTTFSCRAGFSSQTAKTAGFFPLYTQMFFSTDQQTYQDLQDITEIVSSCNADSATYTAELTRDSFEKYIKLLGTCAIYPSFGDELLKEKYNAMKEQVISYASSTTGFINSSIDARIFAETPWKHDSGVYPTVFTTLSIPEVRSILSDIGNRWYTPKNSALFICGNISKEEVYSICLKYFSNWPQYFAPYSFEASGEQKLPSSKQKKFVITDDAFASDFTQIVVQYTGLSMSQTDILSAAFNSSSSPYRKLELSEPMLAIRSKDYLASAVSHSSSSSRLILQALMEKPYNFEETAPSNLPDSAQQAELFVKKAKEATALTPYLFENSQNEILSKYRGQSGNSILTMELLSDFWGFCPDRSSNGFYSRFNQLIKDVISEDLLSLTKKAQRESPYVFVLVSNSNYEKSKDSFNFYGYQRITVENSSWYTDNKNIQTALENAEGQNANSNAGETSIPFNQKSPSQRFLEANQETLHTFTLKNSIPVVVKEMENSATSVISICIKGGEAASPATEHFLRTVMVNYFAVNIQQEINKLKAENIFKGQSDVRSKTEESYSYISIQCDSVDTEAALKACTTAIIYGDILPLTADHLVHEQRTQWLTKSADMSYQMRCQSFASFYSGKNFANAFTIDQNILQKTTYASIQNCYTELLNAGLYSIVITGDIKHSDAKKFCEESFGLLKKQRSRTKEETVPKPNVRNTNLRVPIRHTFTTDRPAEEASPESPILIPTKDFEDPVQFYFAAPENFRDRMIFNALLYEIQNRMEKRLGTISDCYVTEATSILPVGGICTNGVLHTNSFYNAYKLSVQALEKELNAAIAEEENIEKERLLALENKNKNASEETSEVDFEEIVPDETNNEIEQKDSLEDLNMAAVEPTADETKTALEDETVLPDGDYYIPKEQSQLTLRIKNRWMISFLKKTQTNEGTALLIQEGIIEDNPLQFLYAFVEAEKLSAKDFKEILSKYLPQNPVFKCYSQDSQK